MSNDNLFHEVQECFFLVLDLSGDERSAFFEDLDRNRPEVAREVKALLNCEDRANTIFETGSSGLGLMSFKNYTLDLMKAIFQNATSTTQQEPDPEWIDSYRIKGLLGKGGMGRVYKGELIDEESGEVVRCVALKTLDGFYQKLFGDRLKRESYILGGLNHDNIAKLYEYKETPGGLAYFTLEYVEGDLLTAYCDENRLSTKSRIQLLIQICQGLAHAHARGVTHGDLKPDNILVSRQERATIKIIDFGISKSKGFPTNPGDPHFGSLPYISPEYSKGLEFLNSLSDIYSLGAVCFELLTGESVMNLNDLAEQSGEEKLRIVQFQERRLPRDLREMASYSSAEKAILRGESKNQFTQFLTGEINGILEKALALNPEDRYQSVGELQLDLLALITDKPVSTTDATSLYLTKKWMLRNKVTSISLLSGAVLGIVSLIATLVLYQAQNDTKEALRNEQLTLAAMTGFTSLTHPSSASGGSILLVDAFDAWSLQMSSEVSAVPKVEMEVRRILSLGQLANDRPEKALQQLELAYTALLEIKNPDLEKEANLLQLKARALLQLGRPEAARMLLDRALAMVPAQDATHAALRSRIELELAGYYRDINEFKHSEAIILEVLKRTESSLTKDVRLKLDALQTLASLYLKGRNANKALELYGTVHRQQIELLGSEHSTTLATAINHATALVKNRRYEQALPLYQDVFDAVHDKLGPHHYYTYTARHGIAFCLFRQGDYPRAEIEFRALVHEERVWLGDRHPAVLTAQLALSRVLAAQNKLDEALALLSELEDAYRQRAPKEQNQLAIVFNNRGDYLRRQGKFDAALVSLNNALDLKRALYGDNADGVYTTQVTIAQTLMDSGRLEDSRALLADVVTRVQDKRGLAAYYQLFLGEVLTRLKRYQAAEGVLLESYEGLKGTNRKEEAREKLQELYRASHQQEKLEAIKP